MNLHEYQSKAILAAFGLPVLSGYLCHTPGDAEAAADNLEVGKDGRLCVVKAQVQAGGRGKAGGVKLARSSYEAREIAQKMLGMTLVTPQTGSKGKLVRKLYVEAGCKIKREFYLSFLVDRANRAITAIASTEGGVEIEEVAKKGPEKILKIAVNPAAGLMPFQAQQLRAAFGLDVSFQPKVSKLLFGLFRAFVERDLSLLEINPLVLTEEGDFVLLDAKCSVDDNALYRQRELRELMDYDEQDSRDLQAGKFGLSYVGLDGSIGCMVNGAGLAMATMDIIKSFGGEPANFLDVGGGASQETVTQAFKILLSDDRVIAVLVNIFGGIMKCDVIAAGIVEAAKELSVKVPLVVRLQGTNVERGREILSQSGLAITAAETMEDAAKAAVKAAQGARP